MFYRSVLHVLYSSDLQNISARTITMIAVNTALLVIEQSIGEEKSRPQGVFN